MILFGKSITLLSLESHFIFLKYNLSLNNKKMKKIIAFCIDNVQLNNAP
jgi:hypothetical protein